MPWDVDIEIDELGTIGIPYSSVIAAPTGLAVVAVVGGGTFAANTYFWVVTFTGALGETTASNEVSVAIALNGSANLTWNAPPASVTHVKVYRGTAAGAENALIATLGNVAAYTDTGTAGSAATPPTVNTASVQDTLLYTGSGEFRGWSLKEQTGTNAASVEFQDVTDTIAECNLSSAGSETEGPNKTGSPFRGRVNAHVTSGVVKGTVYVGIRNRQGY